MYLLILTHFHFSLDRRIIGCPLPNFIMVGLSAVIFIRAVHQAGPQGELKLLWLQAHWEKVIYMLLALFLYAYAISFLGFILSTFFLLVFLFKAIEPQRWFIAIGAAVLSTAAAYLIFRIWLGSPLPKGTWEIG